MQSDSTTNGRPLALAVVVLSLIMVACLGMLAAAPQDALAKGKTTSVWVITKSTNTLYEGDGGVDKTTYKYTKAGLLKKATTKGTDDEGDFAYSYTCAYDSKYRMKSMKVASDYGKSTVKFTLNKKGYVVKGGPNSYTYNKKGRLANYTSDDIKTKYSYDSKGRVKGYKNYNRSGELSISMRFSYDKKGHITKAKNGDYSLSVKNAYDKRGNLKKQAHYYIDGGEKVKVQVYTYQYKKLKVPAKVAKMVKAQQKNIVNRTLPMETIHK